MSLDETITVRSTWTFENNKYDIKFRVSLTHNYQVLEYVCLNGKDVPVWDMEFDTSPSPETLEGNRIRTHLAPHIHKIAFELRSTYAHCN